MSKIKNKAKSQRIKARKLWRRIWGDAVTDHPGIDYRGPIVLYKGGKMPNQDAATGISYGIISTHALSEFVWDSLDADFGEPHCPKCGNEVVDFDDDKHDRYGLEDRHSCCDHACESCKLIWSSDHVYSDEPVGWTIIDSEVDGFLDSSNDLWVTKSPYYTCVQFCSPCAPGAGHLENPCPAGVKTYCLPPDWFGRDGAPYPGFDVKTGRLLWRVGSKTL